MRIKKIFCVTLVLVVSMAALVLVKKVFLSSPPSPVLEAATAKTNLLVATLSITNSESYLAITPAKTNYLGTVPADALDSEMMIEKLQSLAMNKDTDSLGKILAELNNADPQIRAAARDAAVQYGDRVAVPALRVAANQAEDLDEKKALLEAADYLELPALELPATSQSPKRLSGL